MEHLAMRHGDAGSHAPAYLEARVEAFLSEFHAELTRLSDEEFEAHKESLISVKQQKDHSIEDQAQRHWEEVANRRWEKIIARFSRF